MMDTLMISALPAAKLDYNLQFRIQDATVICLEINVVWENIVSHILININSGALFPYQRCPVIHDNCFLWMFFNFANFLADLLFLLQLFILLELLRTIFC